MKKSIIFWFFMMSFGLVSVSSEETWEEFIDQVNIMSNAVMQTMMDPSFRTFDSNDRIAAVYATHVWCHLSYNSIIDYAPNLSQQDKNRYQIFSKVHRKEIDTIKPSISRFSRNTYNDIIDRYNYWIDYLSKGGIIHFR